MIPRYLKPNKEYDLIRLGQDNDGGYLVERGSISKSKALITLGLGYDWSFEKDFSEKFKKPIYCYDHTVNYSGIKKLCRKFIASYFFRIFKPKYVLKKNFFTYLYRNIFLYRDYKNFFSNKAQHIEKRIGSGDGGIMLNEILNTKKDICPLFLKIDIEGSEYRILDDLIKFMDRIEGLAIEFHDVDINIEKILSFISKFNLKLIHIHANNWATYGLNNIPSCIELSFSKKPVLLNKDLSLPHDLDQKNNPDVDEINLNFL